MELVHLLLKQILFMKKGGGLSSEDTAIPQVLREDAVRQCLTGTAQVVHGRTRNYLHLKFDKMLLLTGLSL